MHKMDEYIGQLLDAIKARPNYYYEDWLIVITSNHGGKADGTYGGMSLEERNMFGIFYYEHLSHPLEMNPGLIEDEVMRFDKQFQGKYLTLSHVLRISKTLQPCGKSIHLIP